MGRSADGQPMNMPHGGSSSQSAQMDPAKAFSDKVDLNDLEWEDRERVLRLLFSKMNAGVQTNTLQARQQNKQAQGREDQMRAFSEQGIDGQMMGEADDGMGMMGQEYRERYGNRGFDQYLQEESQRDEQSQYGHGDEDQDEEEAPLAIEYRGQNNL